MPELQTAQGQHTRVFGVAVAVVLGCVSPLVIDQHALRNRLVANDVLLDLATGDDAHGYVEHERRTVLAGHGKSHRLGPQPSVGTAEGREEQPAPVEPDHANHPLLGDSRRIISEPPDMRGVAQPDKPKGGFPRLLYRQLHRPVHGHDPVGAPGIDHGKRRPLPLHHVVVPGLVVIPHAPNIPRCKPDPVRVVPHQMTGHQMIRYNLRILPRNSGSTENLE